MGLFFSFEIEWLCFDYIIINNINNLNIKIEKSTIFRPDYTKNTSKTNQKGREGGRTVGSGRVATIIE